MKSDTLNLTLSVWKKHNFASYRERAQTSQNIKNLSLPILTNSNLETKF